MDFRSHLGRPMDFRRPANAIIGILMVLTAGTAGVMWLNGEPSDLLATPVYVFLIWALVREIDPDHEWSALAAAALTAAWGLSGGPLASALALAGLMLAARIATSTTGRRPLPTDLSVATIFGIAIGFSVAGWAAGFGIALAIYLDDRFSPTHRPMAIVASALTAIGTTVVASVTGAFPERVPDVTEYVAVAAGVAALILLAREPASPIAQVDARHAAFVDKTRLHVTRSIVGVLMFLMTVLAGAEAEGLLVGVVALGTAVISNEVELLRRRRL